MSAAVILEPVTFAAEFKAEMIAEIAKQLSKIPGMVVEKPMTMKEAAAFLHVHKGTLGKYVRQGLIKPHKVGKNPMFYASELNAQIKSKKS